MIAAGGVDHAVGPGRLLREVSLVVEMIVSR